jgi:hypothetical protein
MHLIQEAQQNLSKTGQTFQLINLDIEKAFDGLSYAIIIHSFKLF